MDAEPLVCCICPFHLPHFIDRARRCFETQTYSNKEWLEWDTSKERLTIGAIRNKMVSETPSGCIVAHFDSDDWSSPERIAEQVAFMQSSGKPVVGYLDMPFYDVQRDKVTLYTSYDMKYVLGTSLMYRREVWEHRPFPDKNDEEVHWLREVGAASIGRVSSIVDGQPRMVATIHPGNTSKKGGARYVAAKPELDCAVRACLQSAIVAQSTC